MGGIRALETYYKGYKFRSRLEARWAVFFDAIGADWEYEPQGYELPSGKYYLPDFRLRNVTGRHEGDLWVEVKGNLTEDDAERIIDFAHECDRSKLTEEEFWELPIVNPIIIVDELMLKPVGVYTDYRCYSDGDQDERHYNPCLLNSLCLVDGDQFGAVISKAVGGGCRLNDANDNYGPVDEWGTVDAYIKARQARFEHGERG